MRAPLCFLLLAYFMLLVKGLLKRSVHSRHPIRYLQHNRKRIALADSSSDNFYITTPIYYVNGEPHLGHAYTSVLSDVIARFERENGKEVYFLTGTDEHGQKVEQSAALRGKSPLEFSDEVSMKFRTLSQLLGCSNSDFIRTTEDRHKEAAKKLWDKLYERGQIYIGAYEGWYAIRDECFYTEDELVNGKAPTGAEVEWVKEESYFFRLSDFTHKLLDFYDKNPDFIGPKGRRNEVISFVSQEGGLKDLSISRTTFSWGIPVPNDPKHVMYVWLDALTNYLTAIGYVSENESFNKFWPASLHVVGKDILRFHAIFWPAFLMAAGLETPKRVFAHGWWTKDGEKMSKSIGNVLDPLELLEKYGQDYLRYFLVSEIHFGNDGDFSDTSFTARINSDLANDIGNLAQRCLTMINKQCEGKIPTPAAFTDEDRALLQAAKDALPTVQSLLSQQSMKLICEEIVNLAKLGNRYIDTQAPWHLLKVDRPRMGTVLYVLAELMRVIAILLQPITPDSSTKMLDQFGVPMELRSFGSVSTASPICADGETMTVMMAGLPIGEVTPIFPRIELEREEKGKGVEKGKQMKQPKKKAVAPVLSFPIYDTMSLVEVEVKIGEIGGTIRTMKAAKVSKDELKPLIAELQFAKGKYEALSSNGVPVDVSKASS